MTQESNESRIVATITEGVFEGQDVTVIFKGKPGDVICSHNVDVFLGGQNISCLCKEVKIHVVAGSVCTVSLELLGKFSHRKIGEKEETSSAVS